MVLSTISEAESLSVLTASEVTPTSSKGLTIFDALLPVGAEIDFTLAMTARLIRQISASHTVRIIVHQRPKYRGELSRSVLLPLLKDSKLLAISFEVIVPSGD
jgi:hypothetical protein